MNPQRPLYPGPFRYFPEHDLARDSPQDTPSTLSYTNNQSPIYPPTNGQYHHPPDLRDARDVPPYGPTPRFNFYPPYSRPEEALALDRSQGRFFPDMTPEINVQNGRYPDQAPPSAGPRFGGTGWREGQKLAGEGWCFSRFSIASPASAYYLTDEIAIWTGAWLTDELRLLGACRCQELSRFLRQFGS